MSITSISLMPPNAQTTLVDKEGKLTREGMLYFLRLANSFQLILADLTGGPETVTLPPANTAPNYEVSIVKISSDANHLSIAPQGNDLLYGIGAWGVSLLDIGPTQGKSATYKSDGNAAWYAIATQ